MKALYCALVSILLLAPAASAQVDLQTDGVGIYADLEGTTNCVMLEPNTALEVYLLLTRPSSESELLAWGGSIHAPDHVAVWGYALPDENSAIMVSGDNVGGSFAPRVMQDVNLLLKFIIMPLTGDAAYFQVGAYVDGGSLRDFPYYSTSDNETHEMHPYVGNAAGASFALNDASLPVDETTLDHVKALYR